MTDIVERLRAWATPVSSGYEAPAAAQVMHEAADEIERLRSALREIRNARMGPVGQRVRNLAKESLRYER